MKSIKNFAIVILFAIISSGLSARQNESSKTTGSKTVTFKVQGNCEMCKDRIEKAAKENAATAIWDSKTKLLAVTFDPKKTSIDAISKKIASTGHDTEQHKAPDEVYAKLPGCCHYERGK